MRGVTTFRLFALCCGLAYGQQAMPATEGETLSGRKVSLPAAAEGQPALLIIGFTHGSEVQTKAWSQRMRERLPVWSIAVLEDVPGLVRGMAKHGIKSAVPKEQYDRFVLVYHGEKQLKQVAGFEKGDDAYVLAIDKAGVITWRFHGPASDAAVDQAMRQFPH
jgi:hypothetical protein